MVKRKTVRKPKVINVRAGSYYPGVPIYVRDGPSLKKGAARYHRKKGIKIPKPKKR